MCFYNSVAIKIEIDDLSDISDCKHFSLGEFEQDPFVLKFA